MTTMAMAMTNTMSTVVMVAVTAAGMVVEVGMVLAISKEGARGVPRLGAQEVLRSRDPVERAGKKEPVSSYS